MLRFVNECEKYFYLHHEKCGKWLDVCKHVSEWVSEWMKIKEKKTWGGKKIRIDWTNFLIEIKMITQRRIIKKSCNLNSHLSSITLMLALFLFYFYFFFHRKDILCSNYRFVWKMKKKPIFSRTRSQYVIAFLNKI